MQVGKKDVDRFLGLGLGEKSPCVDQSAARIDKNRDLLRLNAKTGCVDAIVITLQDVGRWSPSSTKHDQLVAQSSIRRGRVEVRL